MKTTSNELLEQLTTLQDKTISKREAMAAQIMAQLAAASHGTNSPMMIAKQAVIYADALLSELGGNNE